MNKGVNTTCDEGQTLLPTRRGGFFDGPTHALKGEGHDASEDGVMPAVAIREVAGPLTACYGKSIDHGGSKGSGPDNAIIGRFGVRRLTPMECERLQGFPDDYTRILYRGKLAADGPRYKALGNSMAVPCMAWIGRRIALADALSRKDAAA